MARTRFANSTQKKVSFRYRKELIELDCAPYTMFGVSMYLVKTPISLYYKPWKKCVPFEFERGVLASEWAIVLKKPRMLLFKRSEPTIQEIKLTLQRYINTYFCGKEVIFKRCADAMLEAGSKIEARQIQTDYIKKYGLWQFGSHNETQTVGFRNLMKRKPEFAHIFNNSWADDTEPKVAVPSLTTPEYR